LAGLRSAIQNNEAQIENKLITIESVSKFASSWLSIAFSHHLAQLPVGIGAFNY
jgi:hypothetical protein